MQERNTMSKIREYLGKWAFTTSDAIKSIVFGAILGFVIIFILGIITIFFSKPNTVRAELRVNTVLAPTTFDRTETDIVIYENVPEINNNRKFAPADNLTFWYKDLSDKYTPIFKADLSTETIRQNVKMTPALRGKWDFSEDTASFVPEQEVAPETIYQVKLGKELFNDEIRPNTRVITFKTEPIYAKVNSFAVYPTDEKSVIGVAIVSFNYPIQTTDFAEKVSILLNGKRISFDVTLDRYGRTAQIKTASLPITEKPQVLRMKLNRVRSAFGKSKTAKVTANTTIEPLDNFFKIKDLTTIVADDTRGNSQQLILLNTSAQIEKNFNYNKNITVRLLPVYKDEDEEKNQTPHEWAPDEITPDVLTKTQKVDIKPVDFVNPAGTYQYAFGYDVSDKVERYIYVNVKSQIRSANDLVAKNGIAKVMQVPYPARNVKIAGTGILLSLAGSKEIGIVATGGVDTAYVNLYKIEPREINHLITQTYNLFSNSNFVTNWNFNEYDMSVVFQKKIPFSNTSMNHVNYASVNLGEYSDRTYTDQTGIFIVKTGASSDINVDKYDDARLILLTNLGIIRKVNFDKSSSVFVSHIADGTPAADVDVTILARNGRPVWAGITNAEGMVEIPYLATEEYKNEKTPVAIIAKTENDISFMAFESDNNVDFSKFNIDGTHYANLAPLNAYVFSDRGIYRPGETVTIGGLIENKNFTALDEMPVQLTITNPRGHVIFERRISAKADGMFDLNYKTPNDAIIGRYGVDVNLLNSRGRVQESIGSGNFNVQEFVPETMKLSAIVNGAQSNGWVKPENLSANVSLNNMYGTPATDRRISGTAVLRPTNFVFDNYKDYTFTTNFSGKDKMSTSFAKKIQTFDAVIQDTRTDENGNAVLNIGFNEEIPMGTYLLNLTVNGFEAGDGKSIQNIVNSRVSNFDYVVGYKTNSSLEYLNRDTNANLKLIALDNSGNPIKTDNLFVKLVKRETLTSLVKDYGDNYKYQSVSRDIAISQSTITIPESGTDIQLNTKNGGTYFLEITDEKNNILANIEYFVASDRNTNSQTETKADLYIKLDAEKYNPGDTISVSVTAPYTGSGLITIERDKVYAHKWFFADSTSSIQKITLPQDFKGTGYVNVSFVRDINSPDIFTAPYTYAVAPFATSVAKHTVDIKLNAPDIVKDNKLNVEYTTDKDSRIMIFAVNTGILQVANYKTPNPLNYFFQKSALQVQTQQILSLLLPEYNLLRQFAKTGGSDDNMDNGIFDTSLVNPFSRKQLPSVAYYSGIIDAKANETGTISFDIPEYFNGSVSVYAVAAAPGAMGATRNETLVQSPVIISLTTPTFVAPSDKFRVNAIISNMATDSGTTAQATTSAFTGDSLSIVGEKSAVLDIPENTEKLWTFDIETSDKLGTAEIGVATNLMDVAQNVLASRKATTDVSIRPASTYTSEIKVGKLTRTSANIKIPKNEMYSEKLSQMVYISKRPSILAYPVFKYLQNYDYSCTEQLVSRTLPFVLMPEDKIMGTTQADSTAKVAETIQILSGRQNDDGSFGFWSGNAPSMENLGDATTAYLTAYTMNFLTLARQSGFTVPQSMYSRGIDFLRSYAGDICTSVDNAFAKAFAIYVISANDYVTTSYIDLLTEYLNTYVRGWEHGLIGTYMAASYKMLKQNDKADSLFAKYNGRTNTTFVFDNPVANDAMKMFIGARYFGSTAMPSGTIQDYLNAGKYGSFNVANILLGIAGNSETTNQNFAEKTLLLDNKKTSLDSETDMFVTNIPVDSKQLNFDCPHCKKSPLFYAFVRQGFPRATQPQSNDIEVTRTYYDINGKEIRSGNIGDFVDVKITARARGGAEYIKNAVITDLLPGALVPISDSLSGDMDFSEIREDRVLIYAELSREPITVTYRAQLAVAGEFTVPAINASDMYNPKINAVGKVGKITVNNATK